MITQSFLLCSFLLCSFLLSAMSSSSPTSSEVFCRSAEKESMKSRIFSESPKMVFFSRPLKALFITPCVEFGMERNSIVTPRYSAMSNAEYRSGSLPFVLQLVIVWYLIPVLSARSWRSLPSSLKHLSTLCQKNMHIASLSIMVLNIPARLLIVNFIWMEAYFSLLFILTNCNTKLTYTNTGLINSDPVSRRHS